MPISELRNNGQVLDKVEEGNAMVRLLSELHAGFTSGDEQGWVSDEEVANRISSKRERKLQQLHEEL